MAPTYGAMAEEKGMMCTKLGVMLGCVAALGPASPAALAQQSYPVKSVRFLVGFAPGGGTDILARLSSRRLQEVLGQTFVVENRPGADGSIATELAARASPDGYTIVMVSNAHTITPFQRKLGYDPVKDFAPVTLVAANPNLMLVHPSLPVRNVQELIALAKRRPGELSFASAGTGTSPYLSMELFKQMAGIDMVHVPYKGSAPAVQDLVGGHVQLMFGATATVMSYVKANRLRTIAVTSPKRIAAMPEIPTVAESGLPGFEARTWYGVLAPARTPADIVQKLQVEIASALRQPDAANYMAGAGLDAIANRPEEFAEIIRTDMQKWGKVIAAIKAARPS
ncbi:MAG: tripartite tricarboxylate transporter substrate binding protein [Betaproteobacteria bacterium]|nr:MAG: tripartite tricarboxylate transporter substrate binding protein [Betaproteobacteria bacterium]